MRTCAMAVVNSNRRLNVCTLVCYFLYSVEKLFVQIKIINLRMQEFKGEVNEIITFFVILVLCDI